MLQQLGKRITMDFPEEHWTVSKPSLSSRSNLFFFFNLFIFVCVGSSLLHAGFSLVVASGGLLFAALRGPLMALASLAAGHGLQAGSRRAGFSSCGSRALERRLSSCGARIQLLRGMRDPPGPGLKPVSPALAGGLPTTVPPGKPRSNLFKENFCFSFYTPLSSKKVSISGTWNSEALFRSWLTLGKDPPWYCVRRSCWSFWNWTWEQRHFKAVERWQQRSERSIKVWCCAVKWFKSESLGFDFFST